VHVKGNAAPNAYVPFKPTDGIFHGATDMDTHDVYRAAPESPADRDWLRVVGAGVAIVLILAVWTFCT
jgi:hypothetical protein